MANGEQFAPPPREGSYFRAAIGLLAMFTAIGGFAALFIIRVPVDNRDAMMFALGAVFQWAASVISSEYGATTTGRKVAEAVTRRLESETDQAAAADASAKKP
jgi:hypothetical protein